MHVKPVVLKVKFVKTAPHPRAVGPKPMYNMKDEPAIMNNKIAERIKFSHLLLLDEGIRPTYLRTRNKLYETEFFILLFKVYAHAGI